LPGMHKGSKKKEKRLTDFPGLGVFFQILIVIVIIQVKQQLG
jgi:hypothetical protein